MTELAHAGVKGMKWGVRKDKGHEGKKARTKKIQKLDSKFEKQTSTASTTFKIYNSAAERTNKFDIDRINNKPAYRGMDFTRDTPLRQKYYKEHQRALLNNLHKAAKDLGTNASGTKEYGILEGVDGSWDVILKDVKHDDETLFVVKPVFSKDGHITSISMEESSMTHVDKDDAILIHAGVKGMKWGVRKDRRKSDDYVKSRALKARGIDNLSTKELKSLNERLNLERNYHKMSPGKIATGKSIAKGTLAVIGTGVGLYNTINSPAGKAAISTGKRLIDRARGR